MDDGVRQKCDFQQVWLHYVPDRYRHTKTAPEGAADEGYNVDYELAFSTVTARRFCDQHEMSLHTATGRSLP